MCMYKPECVDYKALFSSENEYYESLESFNQRKKSGVGGWRFHGADGNPSEFSISIAVDEDVAKEDRYMEEIFADFGIHGEPHYGPMSSKEYLLEAFSHKPLRLERKRHGKEIEQIPL